MHLVNGVVSAFPVPQIEGVETRGTSDRDLEQRVRQAAFALLVETGLVPPSGRLPRSSAKRARPEPEAKAVSSLDEVEQACTPRDVAAKLRVHENTARELMRRGAIRSFRVGRTGEGSDWRTTPSEIAKYVERQFAAQDAA